MRLSEAILLGDTLKKASNATWISEDGSCGCAFGGALLATGITGKIFWNDLRKHLGAKDDGFIFGYRDVSEVESVKHQWPWLTGEHLADITWHYAMVMRGTKTIEQVADYVRSIEPPEPEVQNADVAVQESVVTK